MKIAYVTTYDSSDIHCWSGTGYFLRHALELDGHEIAAVGPVDNGTRPTWIRGMRLFEKLRGKEYITERSPIVAELIAREAARRIPTDCDIVFSPGTLPLAKLRTRLPKLFHTDATFGGMLGYYEQYQNISPLTRRQGIALDSEAFRNCQACVFASDWAAQAAIHLHDAPPERIHVVPFGANFITEPDPSRILASIGNRSRETCNILFWGVDWERKRGEFAIDVVERLRAAGLDAKLHVVGIRTLPMRDVPEHVINHGFLSKANSEENRKLLDLLEATHFLVLPTRAEAFGIVFAEASAYGIPSLAPRTGGIPSAIADGKNGYLLDLDEGPQSYAETILANFTDADRYTRLAISSFEEYRSRLNWHSSGKALGDIARTLNVRG